jgi:ACS family hexuronate transporter-like MFS transporter
MAEIGQTSRIGNHRWIICALLFFATTINYIDRQVLGILAPELQKVFGWDEISYGNIVVAFQAAYAIGLLGVGRLLDVIGTRLGFLFALVLWSFAAMGHALARSVFGFGTARFFLGLGESGNFPASIKTVAEWFPRRERALATGIFNAGSNVGAIIAPLTVPWIAIHYGWRAAFILTGAIGFLWIIFWMRSYRRPSEHPRLSPSEKAYIEQDPPDPVERIAWRRLFPHRQLWAFFAGKFLTDPIWWFYLYWIPKFLNQKHGLTLNKIGLPLIIIYLTADVGSIAGGWISSSLIKRGWSVNAGRKTAMLICALCVVPIVFASQVESVWAAVALIGLAAAAHQGWSANIFTLVSDLFPRQAVGSVVGFGGMGGAVGGMLIATFVGHLLQWTGSYLWPFVIAGSAYLTALLIIHLLLPRLEPARFGQEG